MHRKEKAITATKIKLRVTNNACITHRDYSQRLKIYYCQIETKLLKKSLENYIDR